jgi:hypothetical protein
LRKNGIPGSCAVLPANLATRSIKQWAEAIGAQKIIRIQDEQRAVDYAMGLIARSWGYFGDFQENMRARQDEGKVAQVSEVIKLICPTCGGPIPTNASGLFKCSYCGTTLKLIILDIRD